MRALTLSTLIGGCLTLAGPASAAEPPPLAADVVPPSAAPGSAWVLDATPTIARLSFINPATHQPGFQFSCRPHSEHIAISSHFLLAGSGEGAGEGYWSVRIALAAGNWSERFSLNAWPGVTGHSPHSEIDPDNPVMNSIKRLGRFQQSEPETVDLSAHSDSERADMRRFFDLCKSDELRGLDPAEAASDARAALAKGDGRYLAVASYTQYAPGLPDDMDQPVGGDVRRVEGTSDYTSDAGGVALNHNARAYATIYNREIYAARRSRQAAKPKP